MRLNRSLEDLYGKLLEAIQTIKTKWVYNEHDDSYETEVNNLKLIIRKYEAELILSDEEDNIEEQRVIPCTMKGKKKQPMTLYDTLSQKFNEYDEYKFYNKVCSSKTMCL